MRHFLLCSTEFESNEMTAPFEFLPDLLAACFVETKAVARQLPTVRTTFNCISYYRITLFKTAKPCNFWCPTKNIKFEILSFRWQLGFWNWIGLLRNWTCEFTESHQVYVSAWCTYSMIFHFSSSYNYSFIVYIVQATCEIAQKCTLQANLKFHP